MAREKKKGKRRRLVESNGSANERVKIVNTHIALKKIHKLPSLDHKQLEGYELRYDNIKNRVYLFPIFFFIQINEQ